MSKKNRHLDLTEGVIWKQMLRFMWPVLISSIFQQLYSLTNQLIVGQYVGKTALSAVSSCSNLTSIYMEFFYGIGLGASIIVSHYFGERNYTRLRDSIQTSLIVSIVGGLIVTVISEFTIPVFMKWINVNDELYPIAYNYLRVYFLGNMAVFTYNTCFHILRSLGDSLTSLYYLIISSFTNLLLGMVFVRVFHMEVIGTALATIISQFIVNILCLRLMTKNEYALLDITNLHFDFSIMKRLCSLGIPAGIQNMLINVSGMVVQSYTNQFSNEFIAGVGVASKVTGYAHIPLSVIGSISTTYVGQNYGAKKYDRVREGIKICIVSVTAISLVVCTVIFGFAPGLVRMFNPDPDVIRYGVLMVRYSVYGMVFLGFSHIYNGISRACGNVKGPMFISVMSQCVFKFIFVKIAFSFIFSEKIIYLSALISQIVAGGAAAAYFYFSKWTKENHLRK